MEDAGLREAYWSDLGKMWHGDSMELLRTMDDESINLILTSPPFALIRKKSYGNRPEDEYVDWLEPFAKEFLRVLSEDGSLVIDIGGTWIPGTPTRSLYPPDRRPRVRRRSSSRLGRVRYPGA